jgi:hypothetical protein
MSREHRATLAAAAVMLAAAVLLSVPAALGPLRLNDSFWIDLVWLEQFARELAHGTLYPRWLPLSHNGLGSPVFYYYPPLAFYLGGLFVFAGVSTYSALVGTFFAANLLSGLGVYSWLRDQSPRALAASLLFMAAPYHLFDFYQRGAAAEVVATAFLPFVLLGIHRMVEGRRFGFVQVALAYAALLVSHLPLALLASLFLFAPYALLKSDRSLPVLLRIAAAFGASILVAAIYLVPAIALEPYRSSSDLWALPYLRPAYWTVWRASLWDVPTFKAMLIVAGGLAAAIIALLVRLRSGWGIWALICTAISVGAIPFLWSLPLLSSVQFPFRLLPVAELAFVTAVAFAPKGRVPWFVICAMLLVMARLITTAASDSPDFGDAMIRRYHPDVPENLPPGKRPYSWPSKWALQLAVSHRQPQFDGGVTVEPVFYFPAWQVRCGGQVVPSYPDPQTELLSYRGRGCSRTLVWTTAEKTGAWISLLALLGLISFWLSPSLLARHRWRHRESLPRNT